MHQPTLGKRVKVRKKKTYSKFRVIPVKATYFISKSFSFSVRMRWNSCKWIEMETFKSFNW